MAVQLQCLRQPAGGVEYLAELADQDPAHDRMALLVDVFCVLVLAGVLTAGYNTRSAYRSAADASAATSPWGTMPMASLWVAIEARWVAAEPSSAAR